MLSHIIPCSWVESHTYYSNNERDIQFVLNDTNTCTFNKLDYYQCADYGTKENKKTMIHVKIKHYKIKKDKQNQYYLELYRQNRKKVNKTITVMKGELIKVPYYNTYVEINKNPVKKKITSKLTKPKFFLTVPCEIERGKGDEACCVKVTYKKQQFIDSLNDKYSCSKGVEKTEFVSDLKNDCKDKTNCNNYILYLFVRDSRGNNISCQEAMIKLKL